ncbi:MAG TPA: membrane dipeptidase [Candidatus Binatia bacterium]|nr:membrane dipeptidase [Candidatus Binatia bacterium]
MRRRAVLRLSMQAGAAAVAAPMLNLGRYRIFAASTREYSARAIELVRQSLVIDMLNPFSLAMVLGTLMGGEQPTWLSNPALLTAPDLQRARDSGFNVLHIAAGTGDYDSTLRFLAQWDGLIAHHSDTFLRVDSPERLAEAKRAGKIGIILGIQDSDHFRTLEDVEFFYGLGQRVSQLTYNARNLIGSGSTERNDSGLSDYGVSVVQSMNRLGMAVDVSHCGDTTTLDACGVSKRPVLITHANCRALNPHPRCKTDEAIKKVAATGGVMGITGVRMFVSAKEPTTIENVLDHYDHVAKLVGVEHLGVGSDIGLDGYDALPQQVRIRLHSGYKSSYAFREKDDIEGLDHPKRTYDLTEGLIRRGYSDADIGLILGGNFQRVLIEIWSPPAKK